MAASSEDHYQVSDCEAEERLYYAFSGYNTKHLHNLHLRVAQWTDPFSIISHVALCKTGRGKNAFQRRAKAHYCTGSGSFSHRFSRDWRGELLSCSQSGKTVGGGGGADVSYTAAQTYCRRRIALHFVQFLWVTVLFAKGVMILCIQCCYVIE